MFHAQVNPESHVISKQPQTSLLSTKDHSKGNLFQLPILNAHEFAPHPKLNVLSAFDTLLVNEETSVLEAVTGFEQRNRYTIMTKNGSQLYRVVEESSFMARCCIGSNRPFSVHISDSSEEEIIHLKRPYRCGCLCCCLQELSVYSPPGNLIGFISEQCNLIKPKYLLYDAMLPESPLFEVRGPFLTCSCACGDVDFPIFMAGKLDQDPVGFIIKKWGGLVKELFTDSDAFGVMFPLDMDVKYKALFLAACFLIDFKHFEHSVAG
ncbi:Phospholipid scramblase 1 [Halotydeus destructor]|nr:Phospholipid scramblase 1 [Halotydeus destructor]